MSPGIKSIVVWARQPTTLQGVALLVGAIGAAHFGLGEALAGTFALAGIPLLIPDNTSAQHTAATVATAAIHELAKERSAGVVANVAARAVEDTAGKTT